MIMGNEITLCDSLMTVNDCKDDIWSVTGAAIRPKKVRWKYIGGAQDCAALPLNIPKEQQQITLFTDKDFFMPSVDKIKSKYKVVFLNECRHIHPFAYKGITQYEHKFDFIVTHDKELLSRGDKYVKISTGTSWVPDDKSQIYKKTRLISHIASTKSWAPGHKLRHVITKAIKGKYDVDFFGSSFKTFEKPDKYKCLKDHCFSITVMNAKNDNYFTETLVDTFRCGTVPIFWGCENIGEYFNEKGILRFNGPSEFKKIMDNLSKEQYYEMMPYVEENFEIAKGHTQMDDLVYETIINKIKELENEKILTNIV